MNIKQEFEKMRRNSIQLDIGNATETTIGETRFGGLPDVPKDFRWPVFETKTYEDETIKSRPLAFLAQFNCAELALLDTEGLLPKTGLLSFFYEMGSQRWGFDPKDAGCAKVFWFDDISDLSPAGVPEDLSEEYRFPALHIMAKAEPSYPCAEDFCTGWADTDWDKIQEVREDLGLEDANNCSKLLGWPDIIQNNMTMECELVSCGYYLGGDWSKIAEQDWKEAEQTSLENWRLLFQLDTVESNDFELMFGDCGRIYFYIRTEDLLARRFDRVWLTLQCF